MVWTASALKVSWGRQGVSRVDQYVTEFALYRQTLSERSLGLTLSSFGGVLPYSLPLLILWSFPWGLGLFLVSGEVDVGSHQGYVLFPRGREQWVPH